jgi:two-component system CheB/CheR fusion protein
MPKLSPDATGNSDVPAVPASAPPAPAAPTKRKPANRRASGGTPQGAASAPAQPAERAQFPIVGVGASAGGLEAFRELLQPLPENTGMGFVLVQHLDPRHESLLPGLLQRATRLPLVEARDGMAVEPDHVYVIPPNASLGILHGVLQVTERIVEKGRHLPVDYFLESLAVDRGSRAMGVILSGTASDGTLGLKAVKTASGITFAQDEGSAEHFGMPGSAIAAGCVDFVLPPREIARELARIARHPYVLHERPAEPELGEATDALNKIFLLLRQRTGHDFTYYKHSTIRRRIKRRMLLHKLEGIDAYAHYVQSMPSEADALFQDILINVTGFFRDPEAYEAMEKEAFPRIFEPSRPQSTAVRVWIPGCSTGEEAYSVAMCLMEYLGDRAPGTSVQIFATDIDARAIDQARIGIYPERISEEVGAERLKRFFTQVARGYRINKSIRDMCVFAVQNVTKDPPFSKIDLVCCRNLMIYLGAVLQRRVLQVFHYALQPKGVLMLGTSETVGSHTELFALMNKKNKLYTKKSGARVGYEFPLRPPLVEETAARPPPQPGVAPLIDVQQEAERLILTRYAPPGVIVDHSLEVLHFRGQTGRYLQPAPGAASLNLLKLARPELAVELRAAVQRALKHGREVRKEAVRYRLDEGGEPQTVDLRVLPLPGTSGGERCLLVLFEGGRLPPREEVPPAAPSRGPRQPRDSARVTELEQELVTTRDYMQSIIEEQESTNEELKAANEEIQSTNEELQSTNEELETSKEELQSTNEELATVNEELENRNQELASANNDLSNLLANVNLPIVMLGADLRIRQFTPQAEKLLNLIGSDLGRPLSNIKPNVEIPRLEELVGEVIDSMTVRTLDVQDDQGRWYSMRVRPYKTRDKRIDGVVITFIDMDDRNRLTEHLKKALEQERRLATVVRDAPEAITVMDFHGRVQLCNPAAERMYGWNLAEALALDARCLVPESCHAELERMLRQLQQGEPVDAFETRRLRRDGSEFPVWLIPTTLRDAAGMPYAVAAIERETHPTTAGSPAPRS